MLDWLQKTLDQPVPAPDEFARLRRDELKNRLTMAVEDRFRPEMRIAGAVAGAANARHGLERPPAGDGPPALGVGLRGYAQIDPKVEYKREGMRIFEQMWTSVGERVTDLIFSMEQLDEEFVGSTWKESQAIHEDAARPEEIARQQQAAIDASQTDRRRSSRSAIRGRASAATIPAPAAAARNTKIAT